MKLKQWALACSTALFCAGAYAAADDLELDGNVVQDTIEDWEQVNNGTSGAIAVSVGREPGDVPGVISDLPPKTIFWKGGSKDINDVTEWWYKDGSVPDKNDIRNGIAAAYINSEGDLVFYFGADRYANTGDAIFGFWFFQDDVGPGPGSQFTGQHHDDDLFVIMEYPQGSNAEPFVQVMQWCEGCGDVSDNLLLLHDSDMTGDSAKCTDGNASLVACAQTNEDDAQVTVWPYTAKTGETLTYPHESFFEGRINVNALLGDDIPCFSSFMIETRSSRSETAQLKDFIGGEFSLCSIDVSKTCSASALNADNSFKIDYEITILNDGPGPFPSGEAVIIDDNPNGDDAPAPFQLNGTVGGYGDGTDLLNGETLVISGSYDSPVNGGTNSVSAKISLGSGFVEDGPFSIGCDSLALSPLLTISKDCDLSLEQVGSLVAVRKDYYGEVCNTGDVPLSVTLSDSIDATLNDSFGLDYAKPCEAGDAAGVCGAGTSCVQYSEYDTGLYLFACQDDGTGDFIEAVAGGAPICKDYGGNYNPGAIPTGTEGMLSNTATAKATSPVVDTGVLATVGESDGATCDLCPLTVEEEPEP